MALRQAYQPSFNLAPSRFVTGLVETGRGRLVDAFRWGLVPPWAADPSSNRMFNARAETLEGKPAFAGALQSRRVAVVAEGFYEWESGARRPQPHYFRRADGGLLLFAGVWERWPGAAHPAGGQPGPAPERLKSCSIVTSAAGEDMGGVHDRMPVILSPEHLDAWLRPGPLAPLARHALLRPAAPGTLVHHPVDPRVGDVRQDDERLILPYTPRDPEPLRLFS